MTVRVEAPGLLSSLQDLGRTGFQHLGVGPSGAMDPVSHRLANLLVGNAPDAASLEITLAGPTLLFETEALVALCGADLSAAVDGRPLPLWRPLWLRAGVRLSFGAPLTGARAYLAVAGGFPAEPLLGSRSTNLAAGFGGFLGRALRKGDRLALAAQPRDRYPGPLRVLRRSLSPFAALAWFAPWFQELSFSRPAILRFLPGPQWPELTPAARASFLEAVFRIGPSSDRMGLRLQGPVLALGRPREAISAPVATGTLQLPADGAPILLMADRQTTGGYPRLGEMASADLPAAAQLRAGESLRFLLETPEAARERLLARERRLQGLEAVLKSRMQRLEWGIISG